MSKKIKTIIWSGVALVVLIAVTIALVLTAPSQSGEGSSNVSVDAIAPVSYTHLKRLFHDCPSIQTAL